MYKKGMNPWTEGSEIDLSRAIVGTGAEVGQARLLGKAEAGRGMKRFFCLTT
jgi:hypothetical protein